MNPYRDIEDSEFVPSHFTYEDIATKLLKDHHFLTALELHTELVESGKELPQLREFFSNPGNFEQHVSRPSDYSSMHRTPSQATLDSLDTTRYSEDGGGDRGESGGDVAVLEFELRKARETINSLRANLTQFADEDSPLDKSVKSNSLERTLKPHEKRALNFLVNEYLLLQEYKLTSITFSDENPDQDFEDWDDVGLNIPRPLGLVSLFWGSKTSFNLQTSDVATEVDLQLNESDTQTHHTEDGDICTLCQHSLDHEREWNHELLIQSEEIRLLKDKIIALETEKLNFQKLYDAAIVSLNSLTSPTSESKGIDIRIPEAKLQHMGIEFSEPTCDTQPLTLTASDNHYGSNTHSLHSVTPDQFELIDNEKNSLMRKDGSNTSSFDPVVIGAESMRDSPFRRGSATTLDDTLSINDGGEWTRVQYDYTMESTSKDMWIHSGLPNKMKVHLLNWCSQTTKSNEPFANDLFLEMVNSDKEITLQGLLTLVADTIPRVIPHMLVARRCEMVSLLVATTHLLSLSELSDTARRTRLLHLLLTLKKSPDAAETKMICEAACLIVKWGSSGEVLSCIAELLSSRSSERRTLASQICLSIAPYVSIELCTSLLLSLVVVMCESSEVDIKVSGLKAACLITAVADHKYGQLENLMFTLLRDPCENIVKDAVGMFVPVLARTALLAGKFSTELLSKIILIMLKSGQDKEWKNLILYLSIMRVLVLAKLSYIMNVQIVHNFTQINCDIPAVSYQDISLSGDQEIMLDIQCFLTDSNLNSKTLLLAMNSLIMEKPDVRWPELNWFISLVKEILQIAISSKCINQAAVYEHLIMLFSCYVESFGENITSHIIKPIFMEIITDLENKMEKLHSVTNESLIVVGIYLVAVLPALQNTDNFEAFLHKWIVYSSIRSLPVKLFSIPFKWVSKHRSDSLTQYLKILVDCATNGSETASSVAIKVHVCNLLNELLNIAHISESCIQTQFLPAIISLMHDKDMSVRESAISAWGGVARACVTRKLECEQLCWSSLESVLCDSSSDRQPITAREAARAAEALSILVLPTTETVQLNVSDIAVYLICKLCLCAPLTNESLSALTPGLQLVAHHARSHPALLPALRKLEEGVQVPSLSQYRPAIEALIFNMVFAPSSASSEIRDTQQRNTTSNLHTAQEVGRRVTQIFQQSKSNMNLPNIFKKKS